MSDAIANAGDNLDHLEASKGTLLSILREAFEAGPKRKSFDAERAWGNIYTAAASHSLQGIALELPKPKRDDVLRYEKIADALHKAHDLLAEESAAETGGALKETWLESRYDAALAPMAVPALPATGQEPVDEDPAVALARIEMLAGSRADYNADVAALERLARASEETADRIRTGPGHPHGSHLPRDVIVTLAVIFKDITGSVPTVPDTRKTVFIEGRIEQDTGTAFGTFVQAYMKATNRHLADGTTINAMKQARAWSLNPGNQAWAPSPFKA